MRVSSEEMRRQLRNDRGSSMSKQVRKQDLRTSNYLDFDTNGA